MYLKVTAKSASLMRAVDFHVLLPYHDGYPDAPEPYAALLFLPGFSSNAEEIIFGLPMRQMSAKYGVAVIVPDGENSFYTDHPERGTCFGAYVGEELPRIARRLFPCLSSRREDNYIGGISMGGYGAAALGLHYADSFSKIALFSPVPDPETLLLGGNPDEPGAVPPELFGSLLGAPEDYRKNTRLNPAAAVEKAVEEGRPLPRFWMCCGEEDRLVGENCERFSAFLRERGVEHDFLRGAGEHDLPYWDSRLEDGFRFLRGEPRF